MAMKRTKISEQVKEKVENTETQIPEGGEYEGSDIVVSTGSTLLDLAISGGRFEQGGIPTGIFVEIFGPSGAGKTVLLCQIAGNVQKLNGNVMFHDPEARLDERFASMFGMRPQDLKYSTPDTVPQVFESIRDWLEDKEEDKLHGVFADSLAALSTDLEMGKDGDKMGMRRAKEFSEEMRKTCRIITHTEALVVCSNQIRQSMDMFGPKYTSPGGQAIGFYSSLRLRFGNPNKLKMVRTIRGVKHERIVGVRTEIEVFKSSVWKPFRSAPVYIIYDYGIDDVRANLEFIKDNAKLDEYQVGDQKLGKRINTAIKNIEENNLEAELKKDTIALWNEIEDQFQEERKPREE